MVPINTLKKYEILKSRNDIQDLFRKGKSFQAFPIRVIFLQVEKSEVPVKVLFSVSKKQFKHAVDRNRFKRLMRDAYRRNKQELVESASQQNFTWHVAFTAIHHELPTQALVDEKISYALNKLVRK